MSEEPQAPQAPQAPGGNRVLFVDDDDQLVTTYSRLLTKMGFQITPASTARQALTLVEEQDFDVAVLDLAIPGGGGISLLHKIRDLKPQLPVIIHSGYLGMFDENDFREMGASRVLTKPVSLGELAGVIQEVIGG